MVPLNHCIGERVPSSFKKRRLLVDRLQELHQIGALRGIAHEMMARAAIVVVRTIEHFVQGLRQTTVEIRGRLVNRWPAQTVAAAAEVPNGEPETIVAVDCESVNVL